MSSFKYKHLYGPVPSRRLGRSLGIDLVPFKVCSYDCIYCQLGSTGSTTVARREYVANDEILVELERKLSTDILPDYISLAGSGEPTLHSGIGELIRTIKTITDVPVAVLTNGSLLWLPEVREALLAADLVLPSLDAGDAATFQLINRPDNSLDFEQMVQGLVDFTQCFTGEVWLEVFLLAGINDDDQSVEKIAAFVEQIKPARVQLNSVYRPPAEDYVLGLTSTRIQQLSELFSGVVEVISEVATVCIGPELDALSRQDEIIALIQRRPCTAADVATGLNMHLNDTLKQLGILTSSGRLLEPSRKQGFYTIPKP
jgi:wyosine [tRNA(Phe)-imidazoG37] synthetase (radical SAM superfamily)